MTALYALAAATGAALAVIGLTWWAHAHDRRELRHRFAHQTATHEGAIRELMDAMDKENK